MLKQAAQVLWEGRRGEKLQKVYQKINTIYLGQRTHFAKAERWAFKIPNFIDFDSYVLKSGRCFKVL